MTHDFSHAAMHRLTDWPVLARIAARQTTAKRLDSRAVAALYARASEADRREMNDAEREFAGAALAAQSPILALQLHVLRKLQALAEWRYWLCCARSRIISVQIRLGKALV